MHRFVSAAAARRRPAALVAALLVAEGTEANLAPDGEAGAVRLGPDAVASPMGEA